MTIIAALLMAQAASASASAVPPAPVIDAAALARIGERGRLLYAYDQAAWRGTDDLLAHHREALPKQGGYIVDGPIEAPRMVFFDSATHRAIYIAHVSGGRVVDGATPTGADADLSPLDQRLIAARDAAVAVMRADTAARPCAAKPFNSVVVPPADADGPVSVYFMTPQTSGDAIPLGGHFRVDVDSAGAAGPVRRFTNTCLSTPVAGAPKGGTPVAAFVTQLIGDRPTEIHVFTSLTLRRPVYVATHDTGGGGHLWVVTGATISGPRALPGR